MDFFNRPVVLLAGVLLILLLIIGGIYFMFPKVWPKRTTTSPAPTPLSGEPIPSAETQQFVGLGFSFSYPANWSVLTCANSNNFEIDPLDNEDEVGVECETAVKPVTVLVEDNLNDCLGEEMVIGGVPTVKSTAETPEFTLHKWCTKTIPILKISHRVSSASGVAVSINNYSAGIEKIIGTLNFNIRE